MSTTAVPAAQEVFSQSTWLRARAALSAWLSETRVRISLISLLVLVPCFWQSHIQAGDLSSHLYNAWLSILIGEGKAPGLVIVPQWTNVLFDWMLSGLMRAFGPWGAEHIAVALLVLNFFWGAFVLVCTISRRRPWFTLTFLAMLAHGWVFHMGFMNFYLAMGLSFWALALLWRENWKCALGAAPLLGLAYLAHALPVAWALGIMIYTWIARRIRPRDRVFLTLAAAGALVVIRHLLLVSFPARWSVEQAISMTGIDQVSVFESKYQPLEFILLVIWFSLFLSLAKRLGEERLVLGIPLQLCVITSAAVLFIPNAILFPYYSHALRYISERMSLAVAVCGCAFLGRVVPGNQQKTAIVVLMGLFFSFLYVDMRSLNHVENLMSQTVEQLPSGARVISALCDERRDVNLVAHTLDRVCIGRCFSYANYEASTGQFRIRPRPDNPMVVDEYRESGEMQEGTYVVKPVDEPLYQIYLRGRYLDTRILKAGDVTGKTCFEATPGPSDLLRAHSDAAK